MKIKLLTFVIAGLCCFSSAYAQKVLLEENVKADTIVPKFGPNRSKYIHLFVDYSFVASKPEGSGGNIIYGKSHAISEGIRYKIKISNFYAIGFDLFASHYIYNIEQNSSKKIPDKVLNQNEKLVFNNVGLAFYNRVNYGKRGDRIGNFIDVGIYGNWAFSIRHVTKNSCLLRDSLNATDIKVVKTGMPYTRKFNYGLQARIGFNRFIISAGYRLSDLFTEKYHNDYLFPELPRLTVGVQVGLHK